MNTLNGAHVLVTRPRHQAADLCALIEQQHGVAVAFPTLEIIAADDPAAIRDALSDPGHFQWLVFISANAVNFALQAIGGKIAQFSGTRIAAIGKATARALAAADLAVDLTPEHGADSAALLATPAMRQVAGQRILIVRGEGGLETLAETLKQRGAEVDYLNVYKRIVPQTDPAQVLNLLQRRRLDWITATSGEALRNLLALLGAAGRAQALDVPLAVVSERLRQLAVESGFKRIFVTDSPSDTAILKTITTWTTGAESGRID